MAAVRRAQRAAIAYGLALLFGTLGCGFLLLAAFVHVARRLGVVDAGLWFGGGFLVLGLLMVVGHRIAAAMRRKSARRQRNKDMAKAAAAAGIALVPALLRSRAGLLAVAAPAIAAVAYAIYRENAGDAPEDDPLD